MKLGSIKHKTKVQGKEHEAVVGLREEIFLGLGQPEPTCY